MLSPNTILQSRYRIAGKLGQGGMGTVYEAFDERLHATVALKEAVIINEHVQKQFEKEARLLAGLSHPALPKVFDYFVDGEKQYLVMEFVPGKDLWTLMLKRRTPFSVEEVSRWADQLLDALDYLHTQEPPVIHRDIKPHNLKIANRGQIKLLDFGLAKGSTGQLTQSAAQSVFGYTLSYAALEQIQGTGTDPRSDLYSLAATLYHFLTASVPPDALTRITEVANEKTDPLRYANEINPEVTPAFASLLVQGMSQNRDKRPQSAADMRQMLSTITKPIEQRPMPSSSETLVLPETDLPVVNSLNSSNMPTEKLDADSFHAAMNMETVNTGLEKTMEAKSVSPEFQTETTKAQKSPTGTFLTGEKTVNKKADTQTSSSSGLMFKNAISESDSSNSVMKITAALLGVLLLAAVGVFGIYKLVNWNSTDESSTAQSQRPDSSPTPLPGIDAKLPMGGGASGASPTPASASPTPKQKETPSTESTPKPSEETKPTTEPTPKPIPKTIQGGVLNGKAINLVKPAYPPAARAVRASGLVQVQVTISETGHVISASAISGHALLKSAAEQAARSSTFSPTLLSGQPVKVTGIISYNFTP